MKKRFLSLFLCIVMIAGILPTGLISLTAGAEEELPPVPNFVCKFDEKKNMTFSFDKLDGAEKYEIRLYYYDKYRDFCNTYHSFSVKAANVEDSYTNLFTRADLCYSYDENDTYKRAIYVDAYNSYGEVIAKSEIEFNAPCSGSLDKVENISINHGILTFDRVENAQSYNINFKLYKTGNTLKNVILKDPINYADFSDVVRDGDYYAVTIKAIPAENDYEWSASVSESIIEYTVDNELHGNVYVNDDKSLSFDGFAGYIYNTNPSALTYKWKAFYNGEWHSIDATKITDYPAYNLRVQVFAPGVYDGSIESYDNTYTDASEPYIATDYDGLYSFIYNKNAAPGKTTYIKLANDISAETNNDFRNKYGKIKPSFDIDLAGYTISVKNTSSGNNSGFYGMKYYYLFYGLNTNFIFRDSKRYDAEKKQTITGKVKYNCTGKYVESAVLYEHITIYGGEFYNEKSYNEHGNHEGYVGCYLKMYDGLIQADIPVRFWTVPDSTRGIFGGTLNTTRYEGIFADFDSATEYLPIIANCKIVNKTGNSNAKAISVQYRETGNNCITTDIAKSWYKEMFYSFTGITSDGTKLSATDANVYVDDGYNDGYELLTSKFSKTYEINSTLDIDSLNFTVVEPKSGNYQIRSFTGETSDYYKCELTWKYKDGTEWKVMPTSMLYAEGNEYMAEITVTPKDGITLNLPGYKSVKINGNYATKNGNSYRYTFKVNTSIENLTATGTIKAGDTLNQNGPVNVTTTTGIKDIGYIYERNGKNLTDGTKATYGDYDCCIQVFAADDYEFSDNVYITYNSNNYYADTVSDDGKTAWFNLPTQYVECVHSSETWQHSDLKHWKVCSICNTKYAEEEHDFEKSVSGSTATYTCKDCGFKKTGKIADTRTEVRYVVMDISRAIVGENKPTDVEIRCLTDIDNNKYYDSATVEKIEWSESGTTFTNKAQTVTLTIKAKGNCRFVKSSLPYAITQYIRDSYTLVDDTTLKVTFSFTPYSPSEVKVTLPEITVGETFEDIAKAAKVTIDGTAVKEYSIGIKENGGEYCSIEVNNGVASAASAWLTPTVKAGSVYSYDISVDLRTCYCDNLIITNPEVGTVTDKVIENDYCFIQVKVDYEVDYEYIYFISGTGAKEPVIGSKITTGTVMPVGEGFTHNGSWYELADEPGVPVEGNFKCGEKYKIVVNFTAYDGYKFVSKSDVKLATINGHTATISYIDDETARLTYTFTTPEHNFSVIQSDENYHWYVCSNTDCNEISGKTAHTYAGNVCSVCNHSKPVIAVTDVKLDKTSLTLNTGESAVLNATVTPDNATNKNIKWSSSDENIVLVNEGQLYAVKAGTATITATTENGNFTATCKVTVNCSHKWDDGVVTKTPTCKDTGIRTYTCTVCKATKTETVAKTDKHTWNSGVVTTKATAEKDGVMTYTCTVCGSTKTTPVYYNHTHSVSKTIKAVAPTCKNTGNNEYYQCSCGLYFADKQCKTPTTAKEETLAKLTTHTWNGGTVTKAPTCKDMGEKTYTCTVCGTTKTESLAKTTNHVWDSGKVTTAATTEKEGIKTYTCTICGATKTESIPKVTEEDKGTLGDINGDGKVTAKDARLLLRYSAKLETLTEKQLKVSDVTKDGKINAKDARKVLRVSAKLETM